MIKANNYGVIVSPNGRQEQDSYTCAHCSLIVTVMPRQRGEDVGGMCKICYNLICPKCTDLGKCDPFEKKLERIEARERFARQAGLMG